MKLLRNGGGLKPLTVLNLCLVIPFLIIAVLATGGDVGFLFLGTSYKLANGINLTGDGSIGASANTNNNNTSYGGGDDSIPVGVGSDDNINDGLPHPNPYTKNTDIPGSYVDADGNDVEWVDFEVPYQLKLGDVGIAQASLHTAKSNGEYYEHYVYDVKTYATDNRYKMGVGDYLHGQGKKTDSVWHTYNNTDIAARDWAGTEVLAGSIPAKWQNFEYNGKHFASGTFMHKYYVYDVIMTDGRIIHMCAGDALGNAHSTNPTDFKVSDIFPNNDVDTGSNNTYAVGQGYCYTNVETYWTGDPYGSNQDGVIYGLIKSKYPQYNGWTHVAGHMIETFGKTSVALNDVRHLLFGDNAEHIGDRDCHIAYFRLYDASVIENSDYQVKPEFKNTVTQWHFNSNVNNYSTIQNVVSTLSIDNFDFSSVSSTVKTVLENAFILANNDLLTYGGGYYRSWPFDKLIKYLEGGNTATIDCSGFVNVVYESAGVIVPDNTTNYSNTPTDFIKVSKDELQPGDLIVLPGTHIEIFLAWKNTEKSQVWIVGSHNSSSSTGPESVSVKSRSWGYDNYTYYHYTK